MTQFNTLLLPIFLSLQIFIWPFSTHGAGGVSHSPSHRVLVKLKSGRSVPLAAGMKIRNAFSGDAKLFAVDLPEVISLEEALQHFRRSSNVAYAEPDYVVSVADVIPNDPLWSNQWDMQKISAPASWAIPLDASDIVVAVIDTGIDFDHPDLKPNLWTHPTEGVHGYQAINGRLTGGGQDDHGHGTHCAGTIGASGNDGVGMAGINWKVKLMAMKFLTSSGMGNNSDAILLLDKIVELKKSGVNIRLTSNSWGGPVYSQALEEAYLRVEKANILNVCAAGNDASDADFNPLFPGGFENRGIISVIATDNKDVGAGFSNFGLASADLAAPGVNIFSTVPTGKCALCDPSGYKNLSGTSMATPHVSGVAAALFAKNSQLTYAEARDILLDPGSLDRVSDKKAEYSTTSGRLNMWKALSSPLVASPRLNQFPIIVLGPDQVVRAKEPVTLKAEASDPDGDALRTSLRRVGDVTDAWLFAAGIDLSLGRTSMNPLSFRAPEVALPLSLRFLALAADGRGGSARSFMNLVVLPSEKPGRPPNGQLTVSPLSGPAGTEVTINFPVVDPDGGRTLWDLGVISKTGYGKSCCETGSKTTQQFSRDGVYRIHVQAVDQELLLSKPESAVVVIGNASGMPPLAIAKSDRVVGKVPFEVEFDLSGSTDSDGRIKSFRFDCNNDGSSMASSSPKGKCVFSKPGPYAVRLFVVDNDGFTDSIYHYVMALP